MAQTSRTLLLLGLIAVSLSGRAETGDIENAHPVLSDKFVVQLGVFRPKRNVVVRVDGSIGGENSSIDFDDSLGLNTDQSFFAGEFIWRFGKKWSLRSQYFATNSKGRAILDEDIEWGDVVIGAGSNVAAGTDFSITRAFLGRSFASPANSDYGVGLGVHWLESGASVEREIMVLGESTRVSASGPLPNIGAWYYYSPSPKWLVGGRIDWFHASLGDYAGGIFNAAIGANYQLFEHMGLGVKYQEFELDADIKKDTFWRGRFKTTYRGLYVYLSGNW